MGDDEYRQAEDEFDSVAHQTGVIYARLRKLRALPGYGAPQILIDHEQQRLDKLADRVIELMRTLIDYDMAHDDDLA